MSNFISTTSYSELSEWYKAHFSDIATDAFLKGVYSIRIKSFSGLRHKLKSTKIGQVYCARGVQ